jgi:hypothetical protein
LSFLFFQIDRDYISTHTSPGFYRGDGIVKDHRHLIFASDEQLKYLSTAKTLFKIVSKPFVQLLSIHFFAKHEDNMKQLTGVFVLMSRKRKKDYNRF